MVSLDRRFFMSRSDIAFGKMTVKEYVLRRLNQGETDLNVLLRQTRIQFPSTRVGFSYVRIIRNEWRKASALQEPTLSDSST
jgi:hypothetical protein